MTDENIGKFASFWGLDAKKYVLVSVNSASTGLEHCVIYNRQRKSAVLIEDPELAREVMRSMVDAGVEIVSNLPND